MDIAEEKWQRCRDLVAKRRAETLTTDEHRELIALCDHIEQANARRIESLVELAKQRHTSLETLMRELGITAPDPI
jgi:triphosphoribosyl-dephospho-CoA synthetase